MISWELIMIATLVVELLICVYAQARNNWVFKHRQRILRDSLWIDGKHQPYDLLPSYEDMLNKQFWRWDINYYLRDSKRVEP